MRNTSRLKLTDLNTYCMLKIFSYLSEDDLLRLCKASQYLEGIIDSSIFYAKSRDLLLCGHANHPSIEKRNQKQLTNYERIQVCRNWVGGTYNQCMYFHHAPMFPTKLCLEKDALYITHASYLRKYPRSKYDALHRRYEKEISTSSSTDISDFVKKQDTIFAGRICGSCFLYEDGDVIAEHRMHSSNEYLYCVDFNDHLYATSTDTCCKLWERSQEFGLTYFDMVMTIDRAFKSMKLSADGQWLFGGLYTDKGRHALRAIHVESGREIELGSRTMSIYDVKLKDEHVIFTANFDTTFRMFDRRMDRDVAIWEDPFDASFYSLEYDGLYGVLAGTSMHSRVNLYDIRMPKYVQLYFGGRTRVHNGLSPVYSLACDSRYLFIATDHNLRVFDFKTSCGTTRDYSNIGVSRSIYSLM
ncbi:hypothetical protein KR026_003003 [Drosophila bipectinata]|nr:hypothetical protein KR026_003003 [Drosophila bipectinata]